MTCPGCVGCKHELSFFDNLSGWNHIASDQSWIHEKPTIAWCDKCLLVQRPRTKEWIAACDQIYANYDQIHPQRLPKETRILARSGDAGRVLTSRSEALINRLNELFPISADCDWLDYGCGSGDLLRTCKDLIPNAKVFGSDVNHRGRTLIVDHLGGVFVENIDTMSHSFDVISMSHVLEHIHDPVPRLRVLRNALKPTGRLLIQVPDFVQNPFDLMIFDHGLFFQPQSLTTILAQSGFQAIDVFDDWASNELTVVASPTLPLHAKTSNLCERGLPYDLLSSAFQFLESLLLEAATKISIGPISIFGAGNGGSWVASQIGPENVKSFLDENSELFGATFHGIPIQRPIGVDTKSTVLGVAPRTRTHIETRYGLTEATK
jgi:SAM-dependent methyltransferase